MSFRAPGWTKSKGCKTLNVSTAKHGHAHVTLIDMLTLQFPNPVACPCLDRHAFKKQLACSRYSLGDVGLLTHNIYDFGKDKWPLQLSRREMQHEPEGMRREFRGNGIC